MVVQEAPMMATSPSGRLLTDNALTHLAKLLQKWDRSLNKLDVNVVKLAILSSPLYWNTNVFYLALAILQGLKDPERFHEVVAWEPVPRSHPTEDTSEEHQRLQALLLSALDRVFNTTQARECPCPYARDLDGCLHALVALTVFCGLKYTEANLKKKVGKYEVWWLVKAGILEEVGDELHLATRYLMHVHVADFFDQVHTWFPGFKQTMEPYPPWIQLVYCFLGLTHGTEKGEYFELVSQASYPV